MDGNALGLTLYILHRSPTQSSWHCALTFPLNIPLTQHYSSSRNILIHVIGTLKYKKKVFFPVLVTIYDSEQTWAKAVDGPSPPQKCLALKSMTINHFAPFKFRIRDGPCGSNFGSAHRKPQTSVSLVHIHWTLCMAEQRHTCSSKGKCHNSKICTSILDFYGKILRHLVYVG